MAEPDFSAAGAIAEPGLAAAFAVAAAPTSEAFRSPSPPGLPDMSEPGVDSSAGPGFRPGWKPVLDPTERSGLPGPREECPPIKTTTLWAATVTVTLDGTCCPKTQLPWASGGPFDPGMFGHNGTRPGSVGSYPPGPTGMVSSGNPGHPGPPGPPNSPGSSSGPPPSPQPNNTLPPIPPLPGNTTGPPPPPPPPPGSNTQPPAPPPSASTTAPAPSLCSTDPGAPFYYDSPGGFTYEVECNEYQSGSILITEDQPDLDSCIDACDRFNTANGLSCHGVTFDKVGTVEDPDFASDSSGPEDAGGDTSEDTPLPAGDCVLIGLYDPGDPNLDTSYDIAKLLYNDYPSATDFPGPISTPTPSPAGPTSTTCCVSLLDI